MALTVGDFKDRLRRAHKRGSALDNDLDAAMRSAAHWIEMNTTLQYMKQRFELLVEPETDFVEAPNVGIKAILTVRYKYVLDAWGKPIKLNKVSQESMCYSPASVPDEFYLDGATTLVFNGKFQENFELVGMLARYTDWPKRDNDTHWLLNNAESLLLTQSMLELGVINTRDERTYQMYLSHRQDQMTVLQNADFETQYAGQDIVYAP